MLKPIIVFFPPQKNPLWLLCVCVCVCVCVYTQLSLDPSLSGCLHETPTTQHTNIVQAQLNHRSPPLSQEFPPVSAQRILLTPTKYEPSGSAELQKKKKNKHKKKVYIFPLIT